MTRDQYTVVQHAANAARRTCAVGREVTYRGGFFVPATARAICIFDAETVAGVTAVNKLTGLPTTDIVEAIDLRAATEQPLDPGRRKRYKTKDAMRKPPTRTMPINSAAAGSDHLVAADQQRRVPAGDPAEYPGCYVQLTQQRGDEPAFAELAGDGVAGAGDASCSVPPERRALRQAAIATLASSPAARS